MSLVDKDLVKQQKTFVTLFQAGTTEEIEFYYTGFGQ